MSETACNGPVNVLYFAVRLEAGSVPTTIVIAGPTAIGKSAVAIALAQRLPRPAEIVSADSLLVYRRFDIGTAKPSVQERAAVPHHLIDVAEPDAEFTLADYQHAARSVMDRLHSEDKVALLVGGTGLYLRAVTQTLDIPATPPDPALRARWNQYAHEQGQMALHGALHAIDPVTAARIHVNDAKRIIRALEVAEKTGRTMSEWHQENQATRAGASPDTLFYGLDRARTNLYAVIEDRVDAMMTAGLIDEVRRLRRSGYGPELKPMQSLGYRQVNAFLDDRMTYSDAVDSMKRETRQYARRQLIWFRADKRLTWLDTEGVSPAALADSIAHDFRAHAATKA